MIPDEVTMAVLEIQDVHVGFGGVKALSGVDLEVRDREILAVTTQPA
jgi:ABC-type sugar transport system ATPase subunit